MTLNELAKQAHENAIKKGFYDEELRIPILTDEGAKTLHSLMINKRLALIHGEVSEALEADRKCKYADGLPMDCTDDHTFKCGYEVHVKGSFEEELADIIIRLLDLAGWKNIDLDAHVAAKMRYNSLREYKHGKKY